jgi:hypothetical protein
MCAPVTPWFCGKFCTDLAVDASNCGVCGHACPATSTCVRGDCRPEVTTIVRGSNDCGQVSLAVADGVLYWTSTLRGTVERIGVDGSARRTLAAGESLPSGVTVVGSNLFWVATSSDLIPRDGGLADVQAAVRRAALPEGAPGDAVVEVGPSPGIVSLTPSDDGKTLYYAVGSDVKSLPVAGGAATTVAEESSGDAPVALAIEGTTLAVALADGLEIVSVSDGVVATCDRRNSASDGGVDCSFVVGGTALPELLPALVLKAGRVYWSAGTSVNFDTATISRPPTGGQVATASSGTRVLGFVGGRDALYFADGDLVERTSYLPGAEVLPLARGQTPTGALAVDATRVYWANADCSIVAVPLD